MARNLRFESKSTTGFILTRLENMFGCKLYKIMYMRVYNKFIRSIYHSPRNKACNAAHLLSLATDVYSEYLQQRLVHVATGRRWTKTLLT